MDEMRSVSSTAGPFWQRSWTLLIAGALAFAFAYSQSPLYTSNQNQYFLHGLATADVGNLAADWLANTIDPTPIFSTLVTFLYRILNWQSIYHLMYVLLLSLYFLACAGIARRLVELHHPLALFLFLVLLIVFHSAAFRFVVASILGPDWAYFFEGGFAGQRILGTVFQPSSFGILFMASIYFYLSRKFALAVSIAGVAAVIHPTYLLTAAILSGTFLCVLYREEKHIKPVITLGLLSLILIIPVLLYTNLNFKPGSPEEFARAQDILVHFRIPHHAILGEWLNLSIILQVVWVVWAAALTRKSRLFPVFVVGGLSIIGLTTLQVLTKSNFLALLFPWRFSSVLVPLSTTAILAYLTTKVVSRVNIEKQQNTQIFWIAGIAIILLCVGSGIYYLWSEYQERLKSPEHALFMDIDKTKKPGDLYLIPIDMQDFRLATGAPAFIEFKAIPYKDTEVLEWHRRVLMASDLYRSNRISCEPLRRFNIEESVTHFVLPVRAKEPDCDFLETVFSNASYRLYEFTP